ncbi:MAG TPA: hypothetical protein VFN67_04270 [Polyangiales bacterium]|nr:hypothetical protein [Polyangiales bacterium]
MSSERAFRIPRAHKDRVHPRQLAAIAATCLSLGIALSSAIKSSQSQQSDERYAWDQASAAPMLDTLPALETAHKLLDALAVKPNAETSISAATTAPAIPVQARAEPQPAAAVSATKPSKKPKLKLVRGALTYRCDSADRSPQKSDGCPHDRAIEARVWRVLAHLATCRSTADSPGRADLRLWFGPGTATRAVFAAPTISPSLNLRAVSQCVARDLSKLRSTRKTDRFELSMSFALTGEN